MNASDIYNGLPSDLQAALAVSVTDPEVGKFGTEELRHLARHLLLDAPLDPAVLDILDATLPEWLDQQSRLQQQAAAALDSLRTRDPLDPVRGTYPIWFVSPWAPTLSLPWAEHLAEAVLEAETYLSSLT